PTRRAGCGGRDRPVLGLAHPTAVPGDALVARLPPRPPRHRRRPDRRHHRRSRRHRTHQLTQSLGHDARVTDGGGGGHPRRWFVLTVLCLTLSMIVIDNTILSVAIPSLARALHADETDLQWIATSYGLVLAGLLLPLAVLGDRYGRKGLLLIGLAVFGVASGAAAFASSPIVLSITRGVMGIGGACAM